MTSSDVQLLRDFRLRVLDETQPLAGLLRTCLMLGSITGSDNLRHWASRELKGYEPTDEIPTYRRLALSLAIDYINGPRSFKGQVISRSVIPERLRQYVPERVSITQPIEDIAHTAQLKESPKLTYSTFPAVIGAWANELEWGQDIVGLYYPTVPSTYVGILGTVRTALVEMVIDMTKDLPLNELPPQGRVDAAVQVHVHGSRDKYEVQVAGPNSGIVGVGPGSVQTQTNSGTFELQQHITKMREALQTVEGADDRDMVGQAIDDFEEAVSKKDPEAIRKRSALLNKVAGMVGSALLSTAVHEGIQAVGDGLGTIGSML